MAFTTKGLDVGALITGIILLVILFNVAAVALPEINTAGNLINASGVTNFTTGEGGLPFRGFFNVNGLIMLGIMAGLILAVFGAIGVGKGRK